MSYIDEYNEYLNRTKKRQSELNTELSQADLEEQDLLHFLEFERCSAVVMIKITKDLKHVRIKRRAIKNELEEIQKVCCRLGSKELKGTGDKSYTYRTDIANKYLVKN